MITFQKLQKLESGIKSGTQVTLNLSSNRISDSINETNFPHNYYWYTSFKYSYIRKDFAKRLSAKIFKNSFA